MYFHRYYLDYDGNVNSAKFEITDANRETGMVTLAERVDYELVTSYNLTVLAVDSGVPPLNSTAVILVAVEDVNDNAPVWDTDFSNPFEVLENETLGKRVVSNADLTVACWCPLYRHKALWKFLL